MKEGAHFAAWPACAALSRHGTRYVIPPSQRVGKLSLVFILLCFWTVMPVLSASSIVSRIAANMAHVAHASNATAMALLAVTARAWALPVAQPAPIALAK